MLCVVSGVSGYVTVGLLARGGMGEVQLGLRQAESFRRLVAIKRLRSEHRRDPSFRRMFLDEARIAGLIRHPNVVSVLDVGDDDDGPFLVMDFIESVTVNEMIESIVAEGDAVPVQIGARIVKQVAHGLVAAHELRDPDGNHVGLIHRDVSPQNILLGFDGIARLTDFGIAKATSSQHTTTGLLKGKVGYMSPEQLRFERPSQKSDLFSLGVVLFELLSGRRLYSGSDTVAVAQKILGDPTPDIFSVRDDVPPALIELSFELLAKDPADRPESARDVAKRLEVIVDELAREEGAIRLDEFLDSQFHDRWEDIRTRSESMVQEWEKTNGTARARRTRAWIAAGVAVLLAAGVSGWLATRSDSPASETTRTESEAASASASASASESEAKAEADTEADTEPEVDPESEAEAEPEAEPDPRTRRRGRRTKMRAMDEFNALELIRGER